MSEEAQKARILAYATPASRLLTDEDIKSLEEIVAAAKSGKVTAFAIVAHESGCARWTSWRSRSLADTYNVLGQLAALTEEISHRLNNR